jgi:DNA polymerase
MRKPFVGLAGQILDGALIAAGLDRRRMYLTNGVKPFLIRTTRQTAHPSNTVERMQACRRWLEAELKAIRPGTIVAMGATAARALLGSQARVMALRGRGLEGLAWAPRVIAICIRQRCFGSKKAVNSTWRCSSAISRWRARNVQRPPQGAKDED